MSKGIKPQQAARVRGNQLLTFTQTKERLLSAVDSREIKIEQALEFMQHVKRPKFNG